MPREQASPEEVLDTTWAANIKGRGPEDALGVVIHANPEFASVVANRLQPYKNFPNTMRPALERVADYVRTVMIPRTFEKEGPGWRKLSKRTQRERAAQGYGAAHPILIRSKDLYRELTEKSHPRHLEIIKVGKYARVEIGGTSEKFFRNQGGNAELRIPPRPMIPGTGGLPVPEEDKDRIRKIMADSIRAEISRKK